jgi:hypothetical protein
MDQFITDTELQDFYAHNRCNINKFDTVEIFSIWHPSPDVTDSFVMGVFPIRKALLLPDSVKETSYGKLRYDFHSRYFGTLFCKKTYNTNDQLESVLAFTDDKPVQFVKYQYNKRDTVSVSKYLLVNEWILEEQIFFTKKKNETVSYSYYGGGPLENMVKKDKQNRIIYEEQCFTNEQWNYRRYQTYSGNTEIAETCYYNKHNTIIATSSYTYNTDGLLTEKHLEYTADGVKQKSESYDHFRYHYR